MTDHTLLNQVLKELARLKAAADDPTGFLSRLYASALSEWAGRLRLDPLQLNRLIVLGDAALGEAFP